MPIFLAIGGLVISGLFGATMFMDKLDDLTGDDDDTRPVINYGLLLLLAVGGFAVYRELKKR